MWAGPLVTYSHLKAPLGAGREVDLLGGYKKTTTGHFSLFLAGAAYFLFLTCDGRGCSSIGSRELSILAKSAGVFEAVVIFFVSGAARIF